MGSWLDGAKRSGAPSFGRYGTTDSRSTSHWPVRRAASVTGSRGLGATTLAGCESLRVSEGGSVQEAETLSPFGVRQRGLGRPRARPVWEQPSSARELGSSQTPTRVDRTASERAGQRPEACQSVLEGTGRSQPLRRGPVAAPGRLLPPVVGTCPRVCAGQHGAAACAKPARDGLDQWEEP